MIPSGSATGADDPSACDQRWSTVGSSTGFAVKWMASEVAETTERTWSPSGDTGSEFTQRRLLPPRSSQVIESTVVEQPGGARHEVDPVVVGDGVDRGRRPGLGIDDRDVESSLVAGLGDDDESTRAPDDVREVFGPKGAPVDLALAAGRRPR